MDAAVLIGWAGLGFSVIMHVTFVSITLGAGLLAAYLRSLSLVDPGWEVPARRVFKLLILAELFSGVWGTIITVFLFQFYSRSYVWLISSIVDHSISCSTIYHVREYLSLYKWIDPVGPWGKCLARGERPVNVR